MKNILLPEKLSAQGEALMDGRANILRSEGVDEASLCKAVAEADAIVLRSKARITEAVLACAPRLKVVSRTGAGIDNVDVDACTRHGVMVCHLPGLNAATVAEHVMAMMLSLLKQLPAMDRAVLEGGWAVRNKNLPQDVSGKTLGIVGMGRIGREVALRAQAFGMELIGYDPFVEHAEGVRMMGLDALLAAADVVTLHLPETPETRRMINAERLSLMKPSAHLINTSRGGVIDEGALVDALKTRHLAGAALDVFSAEPPAADHPLLSLENVLLSPHIAALTEQCGAAMTREAVLQALTVLEGGVPPHIANARALEAKV